MLEVITGYENCLKYKEDLIQKFKRKSLTSKHYNISSKEPADEQNTKTKVYFNYIERNIFNLKKSILWYENKLSVGIYEYYFGLNSENHLEITGNHTINFKENFRLKINYEDINESQFVFAKDTETSKICLLIKLNLSNLSESDIYYFINNYNLFQSNENINKYYFLNLGDVSEEDTIFNFFSFISKVRVIDNSKPYLKIATITNNFGSSEAEKQFYEKLEELFDENSFSEDIIKEHSINNSKIDKDINPDIKKESDNNTDSKNQTNKKQTSDKNKANKKTTKPKNKPNKKTSKTTEKINPPLFTSLEDEKVYDGTYNEKRHNLIILGKKVCDSKELLSNLAGVTVKDINSWYQQGYEGKIPFNRFYIEYIDASEYYEKNKNHMSNEDDFNSVDPYRLKVFNAAIKEGKSKKFACKIANFNINTVEDWIYKGNHKIKPYVDFANEYHLANDYAIKKSSDIPNKVKIKVINLIKSGKTLNQAAQSINKGIYSAEIIYQYNKGEMGDEYYYNFYYDCKTAREEYLKAIKVDEEHEPDGNYSFPTAVTNENSDESFERPYDPEFDNIDNFIYFSNSAINSQNSFQPKRKYKENQTTKHKQYFTDNNVPKNRNETYFLDKDTQIKLKLFYSYIEKGKTINEASKLSDLNFRYIHYWISQASSGNELYLDFYKKYSEAKKIAIDKNNYLEEIRFNVIKLMKKGKTLENAIILAKKDIPKNIVLKWYTEGSKGNEKYVDFYNKCNEAKEYYESKNHISKNFFEKLQFEIKTKKIGENKSELTIRTTIRNTHLIPFFSKLNGFEDQISQIITTSISDETMNVIIKFKVNNSEMSPIKNLFNIN